MGVARTWSKQQRREVEGRSGDGHRLGAEQGEAVDVAQVGVREQDRRGLPVARPRVPGQLGPLPGEAVRGSDDVGVTVLVHGAEGGRVAGLQG